MNNIYYNIFKVVHHIHNEMSISLNKALKKETLYDIHSKYWGIPSKDNIWEISNKNILKYTKYRVAFNPDLLS